MILLLFIQIENIDSIKAVAELGGTGIALWWIWSLRKDVGNLGDQLSKLNAEHKSDLKEHAGLLTQLQQSVLHTLNDFKTLINNNKK